MHVSRPRVISQGLVRHQIIEFGGIRTDVEVHLIQSSQYGVHDYVAYVIDDVPDWLIALPLDRIVDWFGSGVRLERAVERGLRMIGVKPSRESVDLAVKVFNRWFNYYGALTPLLLMDDVTDIHINKANTRFGLGGVYIEHALLGRVQVIIGWEPYEVRRSGKAVKTITFDLNAFIDYLMRRVAQRTRTAITTYNPVASVVDPEFGVRVSAESEPVSPGSMSIRVLPRRPWTLPELIRRGMIGIEDSARLWLLADHKVPILITGPMGSGKTSLQNAVAFMLVTKSMALIMDVAELFLPHHQVVKPMFERVAYAHGIRGIDKAELIRQALRSGVDVIVLNEARSRDEFRALAEAVTLGHGALTTFHAEDYRAAEVRLANMGLEAEELLKLSVVVEVGMSRDVRFNPETGVYEVVTRRFVRRIHNTEPYMNALVKDYGPDYVSRQLELRTAFLTKAVNANIDHEQLAGLLYVFYKQPEAVLKAVDVTAEVNTEQFSGEVKPLPLPDELLSLDSEAFKANEGGN
ncbi:type II/IV secretion system ATPase subunit [Vulcanisaeta distributa]|uniref:Type II secretion system protein E n=1 Tax=Vulcanisaeta distributa (strain DSM 14429 / JCM 11212 / NBRC 100878 / IC-017) TaxID=572478 RepID=E1QSP0_VULDI|nr:type II/IV secretion system ATPase subunit [Vulcanisaeta distributa]ADN49557.1 type II secretion system protein E [Vulcanisaeta distributa DSM 14429]